MRAEPPRIVDVVPASPAERAGVRVGDLIKSIEGEDFTDVIGYQLLIDGEDPLVTVERSGRSESIRLEKAEGEPAGIRLATSLFDKVRTCDNKCSFCFVYQLPEGMRESLYLKDDDYRLSFLYGNFTTLTRFKEADLERVLNERISPLHVSIHTTDPALRASMLNNRKGGKSLDWLDPLISGGIEIHGQIVLCPGINDGEELERTLREISRRWPRMASVGVVPVGLSRFSHEPDIRPMTPVEMRSALETIEAAQQRNLADLGRRQVFASDEFFLGAGLAFPPADTYEGFPQYENGIGMAASLAEEVELTARDGFTHLEGAPADGYRAPEPPAPSRPRRHARPVVITGEYGAMVLEPIISMRSPAAQIELMPVKNDFFGGNVAVTGLLAGRDVAAAITARPSGSAGRAFVLPGVMVPEGRFIDDVTLDDLRAHTGAEIEVVPPDATGLAEVISWAEASADETSTRPNALSLKVAAT